MPEKKKQKKKANVRVRDLKPQKEPKGAGGGPRKPEYASRIW
jgi:hypothetical protein